jgi:hypothetical protein
VFVRAPFVCFNADDKAVGGDPADDKQDKPDAPATVPVSELQKERKARRQLEEQLAKFEEDAEKRKQAEMTEAERLKQQLSEAVKRAEQAETAAAKSTKQNWLRDAAAKLGFIDATDAVARIDVSDLEDEQAAREAVKDLKQRAPHLVAKKDQKPDLDEVLRDGQRPGDKSDDEPLYSRAELDGLSHQEIQANWDRVERSMAALGS